MKASRYFLRPAGVPGGPVVSAGFTLMEILLALSILAIVTALVYGAYGGTEKIVSAVVYEDRVYRMARNTLSTLARDLSSLGTAEGVPLFVAREGTCPEAGREVLFLSLSTAPFFDELSPGLSRMEYYFRKGPEEDGSPEGYQLVRREVPFRGASSRDGEKGGFVLCESVKSMSIRFYRKGSEYDDWDSRSDGEAMKGKVPDRITLELRLVNPKDKDRPFTFLTAVSIPLGSEK